jgi:hypothetical protein
LTGATPSARPPDGPNDIHSSSGEGHAGEDGLSESAPARLLVLWSKELTVARWHRVRILLEILALIATIVTPILTMALFKGWI